MSRPVRGLTVKTMTTMIHTEAGLHGAKQRTLQSIRRSRRIATAVLVVFLVLAATILVVHEAIPSSPSGAWHGRPSFTTTETTTTVPTPAVVATTGRPESTRPH